MFKKHFTQKNNSLLKKADRKTLQDRVKSNFYLDEGSLERVLPKKQDITVTRIQTHQDAEVNVYSVEKRAILFEYFQSEIKSKRLLPTVYFLWQHPDLAYSFTVYDEVLEYILTGANLMMPGVVKTTQKSTITYFIDKQIASIHSVKNKSAMAIGLTAMSGNSGMGGEKGKAVTVLHYYNDYLCGLHDMPLLTIPQRRFDEEEALVTMNHSTKDMDWPPLSGPGQLPPPPPEQACPMRLASLRTVQPKRIEEDIMFEVTAAIKAMSLDEAGAGAATETASVLEPQSKVEGNALVKAEPAHVAVDAALHRCFMIAVKYSPTLQLPQLTSSFYKKEMVQMMSDQQLDIKASSYKKVSEFLKAMQKEGLCRLGQKQKGVDTVEEIHYSQECIAAFYLPVESRPKVVEEACAKDSTKLNDAYMVVPEVVDIFLPKHRVGAKLTLSVAKKSIIEYIKRSGLQDIEKEYTLARTPVLQRLCPPGSTRVPNEELLQTVLSIMEDCNFKTPCTSAAVYTQTRLSRPVRMQVQTHSGKTVTIVSNLQDYSNVHLATFAKEVQVIAAASAKVVKETRQIQVQGNQVDIIGTLLNKKYGISKSKMVGLELAPKLKKCKH